MPTKTKIEWTDYTSNPIAPIGGGWGCSKVSPGCDHCYAERLNKRMGNKRDFQGRWDFTLKQKELDELRRLNDRVGDLGTPTYVFLGDMTDIFHLDVPFPMLEELFVVLDICDLLTVQVLTKRPGRMAYFANHVLGGSWPPNVWAGTSVESQKYTPRLDVLARVLAKVRFVSYEPSLGPVEFTPWLAPICPSCDRPHLGNCDAPKPLLLSWVIAGGESGHGARPMHPAWVRDVRDQCKAAGVPIFFKQWGEWAPWHNVSLHEGMERCAEDSRSRVHVSTLLFERTRWPHTPACPLCGGVNVGRKADGDRIGRWNCHACHSSFNVLSGTIFEKTKVQLQKWFLAISLVLNAKKSLSSYQLSRDLELNQKTAWFMAMRIRKAMVSSDGDLLAGIVEADEAYVGGKPRKGNKREDDTPAKRSRGTDKLPIVGVVERGGRVVAEPSPKVNSASLTAFLSRNIDAGSLLITDAFNAYRKMGRRIRHAVIDHSVQYVDGMIHTNTIEGFWSLLKRAWYGTHHHYSDDYALAYSVEACFKYNGRNASDTFGSFIRGVVQGW